MIKLFGWEKKMSDMLDVKREEELKWLKARELIDLAIKMLRCVIRLFVKLLA